MGEVAYFTAIRSGDVSRLARLVAERPALLAATTAASDGRTGLHAAVHARQSAAARVLVEAGIDLEARNAEGRTALHDSIEFGVPEITELLLARGAELDLCSAAILGRLERVRELLDRDPAAVDDRSTGLSPLGWAAFGNQVAVARELLRRGARMDDGELLCAASVGHVEVGRVLIEHGADPDRIDERACGNALHAAVAMRYTHDSRRFVEMLLERGADIDARTPDGRTALRIAEDHARRQDAQDPPPQGECGKDYAGVAALLRQRGAAPG